MLFLHSDSVLFKREREAFSIPHSKSLFSTIILPQKACTWMSHS